LQQNTAPPVSDSLSLPVPAELARLDELPTPEGADPAVFAALKSELAGMLRARGDDRIVSAPPMLPGSSAYLSWDSDLSMLSWGYCCSGDYNQDSLVGVNDITPLGQNYLAEVPGDPYSMLAVVDGNGDGLITVNDITQIGQNYGVRVTAYNVYASSELSDYPSEAASGNGAAALLGSVPFPEGPPPAGERRRFSFAVDDPQFETYFWVRPTDGANEGTPSSYYHLAAPANQPPVASLTTELSICDIGEPVEFDASLSTDPDGEIVKFEWDWDGMQGGFEWYDSGTTATVEHSFDEVGTFGTVVRVTDDEGAVDTAAVEIIVTPPGLDPPVAVLTAEPTSGYVPLAVSFSAEGSYDIDGTIEDYEWDLDGDGDYGEPGDEADADGSATAGFTYTEAGLCTASVKVTDNDGASDEASVSVSSTGHEDWWMFGHDLQHTRRSPYVGAQTNSVKWSYGTEDPVWSSPAIGTDGTIYVGCGDLHDIDDINYLYALNADGSLKWSYTIPGEVHSSPAIGADGTVYVGSAVASHTGNTGKLYAINPDGSLKWSYTAAKVMVSSPAIAADGTIYVGWESGKLYAFNPGGSLKWSYTAGSGVGSPAIGVDGTVYVGCFNSNLYAINPDGSLKWSFAAGGNVHRTSPAIGVDGTIYVGSDDHNLYAINPNGSLKWSYTTGWFARSSPAIGADGTVYVGSIDNKLYAINPDGSLKWTYTTGDFVWSSPAIGADGTVYVGSFDDNFYAINPDGSLKWEYETGGYVRSSPAIGADGTVYVGSDDCKLYAFGL